MAFKGLARRPMPSSGLPHMHAFCSHTWFALSAVFAESARLPRTFTGPAVPTGAKSHMASHAPAGARASQIPTGGRFPCAPPPQEERAARWTFHPLRRHDSRFSRSCLCRHPMQHRLSSMLCVPTPMRHSWHRWSEQAGTAWLRTGFEHSAYAHVSIPCNAGSA